MDKEMEELLKQVPEKLTELSGRVTSLEDSAKPSTQSEESEPDKARITELEAEVARLSDHDHEIDVVSAWAQGLTRDAYLELGVKLGYVEEAPVEDSEEESEGEPEAEETAATEETPEPEAEAADEENQDEADETASS